MELSIGTFSTEDWADISALYSEGIQSGQATFEVEMPTWEQWNAAHLQICRLAARSRDTIVGWAALSPVSKRPVYRGVAEVSVYVSAGHSGQGIGTALLDALIVESERQGIWTLQGSTFPENTASIRIQTKCGFRIVGRREKIAMLHGVWHDTILTERRSKVVGVEASIGS